MSKCLVNVWSLLLRGGAVHQVLPSPVRSVHSGGVGHQSRVLWAPSGLYSLAEPLSLRHCCPHLSPSVQLIQATSTSLQLPSPPPARALKKIPQLKSLRSLNPPPRPVAPLQVSDVHTRPGPMPSPSRGSGQLTPCQLSLGLRLGHLLDEVSLIH